MLVLFIIQSSVLNTRYNAPYVSYVSVCPIADFYNVSYNLLQSLSPGPPTSESPSITYISAPFTDRFGDALPSLRSYLFYESVNDHIYICNPKKVEAMFMALLDRTN
jgi:hypothetical protein